MALPAGVANTFDPVNVAGVLFNKTDVTTPLFNAINGSRTVQSRKFVVGVEYALANASQPALSEENLYAGPAFSFTDREQKTNVTQPFYKGVAVTYSKLSDTDSLTGVNVAGLENSVQNELAFQIGARLKEIRNDIEYTILNGVYNEATSTAEADKTRGLIAAAEITIDADGSELTADLLINVAKAIAQESPYGLDGVVGILNAEQLVQLNKILRAEGDRISPTQGGANMLSYLTPFGTLKFLAGGHRYMPNGTALFATLGVCRHAMRPVPGKGNFFYEALAKDGASEKGQIFGQWGLDHGPGWMHAKIVDLATTTDTSAVPRVYVVNSQAEPIYTQEIV